ncbi:threonine-phosphate decarboxylase CobD [Paracoccus fistulariae]|uniref:threonine-phosphate decarboxylase n=1 Tax=Paracoccus fistulariae TaxID=658446 RepID=A0ABY7SJ77_9RHOB|nr:threonine-phosphate decarboxylase CobD [Paracoccus fistulariae]MDB6180826.1 threonine-phosphate decarboxylase CobD [Paracoccus fistulariae]WCR06954.1 threonine-phosphate decarboxylase [Paracoccus fistulariae]
MARDHGGNIDWAMATYGGGDWIDLSTGINRRPWPVSGISDAAWRSLPTHAAMQRLIGVAAACYRCDPSRLLAVNGASAAIQMIPRLFPPGRAAVLTPTYNEHAASLRHAGWPVSEVSGIDQMEGFDLAVLVNPNNPDGREWQAETLATLATTVGHLVVDESFADPRPDLSLIPSLPRNALVLRSFGKFWGLAGLRLGFVIAQPDLLARLAEAAGPWAVNGPALDIATAAMADREWAEDAIGYHCEASLRLDRFAMKAGWQVVGGTHLFRLYDVSDAQAAQTALARHHIWTRRFPYSKSWMRMGVPGNRQEWDRIAHAFKAVFPTATDSMART